MRFARIASLLALAAVVATAASSSSAAVSGPTGLHGFLLRADEPAADSFHRTPAFAWDPFPGAVRYQFQLSTSSTFRENSIFYNTNTVITPVAAPKLVLPWINGLFARVRGIMSDGDVTVWSDDYGFDVEAPAPPRPMSATDPGLLRWSPSEGATGYQVWLVDVPQKSSSAGTGKQVLVHTNVLDEREFYTFHQTAKWIGTVRWRVRAQRSLEAGTPANGLPATSWGGWSPVYSSSNPAVTGGPIKLLHTISDVVANGDSSTAHRLMTGFTWSGNQTLAGTPAELYRVYAFTDKACLNRVYTSPVIGSPAYAPRPFGPLGLPQDAGGIASARGKYIDDGSEPIGEMYDGTQVTPQESAAAATATSTAPPDLGADLPAAPAAGAAPGSSGGSSAAPPAGGAAAAPITPGAPVDLWDTDLWPKSGYYWIVVGVGAASVSAGASTVAAPGASQGSTLVPVSDVTQFVAGQSITIGVAPNSDTATISAIGNGLITLASPLNFGHAVGSPIQSTASSSIVYRDMELPQDVCAVPSRVQRFGITSEPSLTTAQEPFATGLSPTGRLVSAARTATFYGQPLVAWTPALSADTYQVQWSKKEYPFKAEGSIMTPSTATVLPLAAGTWFYRVRGFDYNLPTGAQMLSWSDTEELDVAKPQFKIVPSTVKKNKFKILP